MFLASAVSSSPPFSKPWVSPGSMSASLTVSPAFTRRRCDSVTRTFVDLRVPRPRRLAGRIRHAGVEPPRRFAVPHGLSAADLRCEIAEHGQLLHLPEEVR